MFQTTSAILYIIAWAVPFSVAFLKVENFLKVSMIFFVLIFSYTNPTICTDAPETNCIPVYKSYLYLVLN